MSARISPETVWQAQAMYCVDRLSFAEAGRRLGISADTVRRWADKYNWRAERETIAATEAEIRFNTVKGRAFVLRKLLEATDGKEAAQMASAVSRLEKLALDSAKEETGRKGYETKQMRRGNRIGRVAGTMPLPCENAEAKRGQGEEDLQGSSSVAEFSLAAHTDKERAAMLEEAVNRQIAHALSSPEDFPGRVRGIKAALEVLSALKGKDAGAGTVTVRFLEEGEAPSSAEPV